MAIAEEIAANLGIEADCEFKCNSLLPIIQGIGVYEDPKETSIGKEGCCLLLFLKHCNQDYQEIIGYMKWVMGRTSLLDLKNTAKEAWIEDTAILLHRQGWQLRWDSDVTTAEEAIGGIQDIFGHIYLSDGVSIAADQEWDRTVILSYSCHVFRTRRFFLENNRNYF